MKCYRQNCQMSKRKYFSFVLVGEEQRKRRMDKVKSNRQKRIKKEDVGEGGSAGGPLTPQAFEAPSTPQPMTPQPMTPPAPILQQPQTPQPQTYVHTDSLLLSNCRIHHTQTGQI